MSDDIADAIENIENADELDDETREKLKQALADSESSDSDEGDEPEETRVDPNPMGAQVEAEKEDEAAADGDDEGDAEEDGSADLDDETRDKIKQVLADSESAEQADASDEDGGGEDDEPAATAEDGDDADGDEQEAESDEVAAEGADEDDQAAADTSGGEAAGDEGGDWTSDGPFGDPDTDAIGGVFTPGDLGAEGDDGDLGSAYLGARDIEGYEERETNPTVFIMGGFIVFLMVGFSWFLLNYTEQGERMKHLFQGDLQAYEQAKSQQIEEKFRKEQLDKMPQYGNLTLNGRPTYANIILDGKLQYGKIPETGEWRPVLLTPTTQFQNLNVAEKHDVKIRAPNHESKGWTLTEQMWMPVGKRNMNFKKTLTVNLMPESAAKQIEFQQRMEKNPDENYFGEVTINSKPEGAKIIFDGKPLLDEDGEQRTTPVTFEKAYWKNEETGEIEEQKVKVDMPPDRGHKIQLRVTDEELDIGRSEESDGGESGSDGGDTKKVAKKDVEQGDGSGQKTEIKDYGPDEYPKYVTPLERQMWTCEWKDGEKPDEPPYPKHCNYSFELNADFEQLKSFIEFKKEQRKNVKDRNAELENKLEELKKKLSNR